MVYIPERREVKLHPNNLNWNHRTKNMVEQETLKEISV